MRGIMWGLTSVGTESTEVCATKYEAFYRKKNMYECQCESYDAARIRSTRTRSRQRGKTCEKKDASVRLLEGTRKEN